MSPPLNTVIEFTVDGLPPKKDGANSMWRKPTEVPRVIALRAAARVAMNGRPPLEAPVRLSVDVYADPRDGDLDNFITGICDALQAPAARTEPDPMIGSCEPIAFQDDRVVWEIVARRRHPSAGPSYEVRITHSNQGDAS